MTMLDRSGGSPVDAATSTASPTADATAVERKGWPEQVALFLFITLPFLALLVAVPVAWGGWLGWHDVVIAVVFYVVAGHGDHRRLPPVLHPRLVQGHRAGCG